MPKGQVNKDRAEALYRKIEPTVRDLIENQKLQQWKVANILGTTESIIYAICKRYGIKTQRTGPRSGEGHTGWKGGRVLTSGYWYVWCPEHPYATKQGRVAEHRLAMEAKLGRYLEPNEVVHHIDGNRKNNLPDNLIAFQTNSDHLKHELTGKRPKWTRDGFERMCASNPSWEAIRRELGFCDGQPPQPTDHQTS